MCLVLALALLPGCRRGGADGFVTKGPDGAINLAVGATADLTEPVTDFRLEDYFEEIGTNRNNDDPRTFLWSLQFSYYDDRTVLAETRDGVVRLLLEDGSFVCEYGHVGRGPGEYIPPYLLFAKDGEVYVSELNSSVCHVYAGDGGAWLRDSPLTDNGYPCYMYAPLGEGLGVLTYSSLGGKPQMFDIVDTSGHVVREGTVYGNGKKTSMEDVQSGKAGIQVYTPEQTGGSICLMSSRRDTLYRVTALKDEPWLVLDPGRYRSPNPGELSQDDSRDIFSSVNVCGDLAFLNISVAGGTRMAVYDMQKGELLFCVFSSDGENPPLTYGIPYERDGETVYLAPVKTDRDLLVCVDRNAEDFYSFRLKKQPRARAKKKNFLYSRYFSYLYLYECTQLSDRPSFGPGAAARLPSGRRGGFRDQGPRRDGHARRRRDGGPSGAGPGFPGGGVLRTDWGDPAV